MIAIGIILAGVILKYFLYEKSGMIANISPRLLVLMGGVLIIRSNDGILFGDSNNLLETFILMLLLVVTILTFEYLANRFLQSKGKVPGKIPKEIHLWKSSKHSD